MKYEEDLTSRENLLLESEPSEGVGGKEAKKLRERFFKCYVIAFAIFVWTGYTLLVAYTRQMTPKSEVSLFSIYILKQTTLFSCTLHPRVG